MRAFEFYNPVNVVFGNGTVSDIEKHLTGKYKRYLLVSTGSARRTGVYEKVKKELIKAGGEVFEIGAVPTNPKMENVYEGVDKARKNRADCVVALGGGSVMDCSKIIAMAAKTGTDARDYVWGNADENTDSLPTVMIPTIAATGTELNNTAVVVDGEKKEKSWCYTAYPEVCFIDPEVTATLPKRLTVWGAMDILSHTFEYYMNGCMESEFQLCFSEGIILAVMSAVERLVENPEDLTAAGELLWTSSMTWGTGLTKIGRGDAEMSCHNIEERFSGYFDTHHGGGLGVITPRWMKFVCRKRPDVFARFARNVMKVTEKDDEKAAVLGVQRYIEWLGKIGAPKVYRDLNQERDFGEKELDIVVEKIWKVCAGKVGRLVPLSKEDIRNILYQGNNIL